MEFSKNKYGFIIVCILCFCFGFFIHYTTFCASLKREVSDLNEMAIQNAVSINSIKEFYDGTGLKAYISERVANIFHKKGFSLPDSVSSAASVVDVWSRYNVEPSISIAVIDVESGFDTQAVSSRGALGLMQIIPSTGRFLSREYGDEWNENILCVPEKNIMYGGYYIYHLKKDFEGRINNSKLYHAALTAYNMGPGYVHANLEDGVIESDYSRNVLNRAKYYITKHGLI